MEKQRLARSGGGTGVVTAGPATNGHPSNIPQRHHQQPHQVGQGRANNRSNLTEPVHHKVAADAGQPSQVNDLATGHSLPHSHRRISNAGGGAGTGPFIRLEPRPAPSHSNTINSQVANRISLTFGFASNLTKGEHFLSILGRG